MAGSLSVGERIRSLFDHLGIEKAHFAARMPEDWSSVVETSPDLMASLTLVAPTFVNMEGLKKVTGKVCVMGEMKPAISDIDFVQLAEGTCGLWGNVVGDNAEMIQKYLRSLSLPQEVGSGDNEKEAVTYNSGSHNGIAFKSAGTGPVLVLMPLALATDGWTAILDKLKDHFRVVVLGGKHLGFIPFLEERGCSAGYSSMIDTVVDRFEHVAAESSILEVGSGTGVVLRQISAKYPCFTNLTGIDLNAYLVEEAHAIARDEDCGGNLSFQIGNATKLPFPDNHFDVVLSTTVGEEVDADQMMVEMKRVCKPGGFLAVIVRGEDLGVAVSVNLPQADLAKFSSYEYNIESCEANGSCASHTLYRRFQAIPGVGLDKCGAYSVDFRNPQGALESVMLNKFLVTLSEGEKQRWSLALTEAGTNNTFVMSWFHHFVAGRKSDCM